MLASDDAFEAACVAVKEIHLSLDRPPAAKANESPEFALDMVASDLQLRFFTQRQAHSSRLKLSRSG